MFELLDDLRDQIGAHYSVQLFELSREQTCAPAPIKTTAKSTINRSEHHNLKGPKRGPFVSQRPVAALCMVPTAPTGRSSDKKITRIRAWWPTRWRGNLTTPPAGPRAAIQTVFPRRIRADGRGES